jgi:hypothetical protein
VVPTIRPESAVNSSTAPSGPFTGAQRVPARAKGECFFSSTVAHPQKRALNTEKIEIRCKKEEELIKKCLKIKNIENINLLSHDGERRF